MSYLAGDFVALRACGDDVDYEEIMHVVQIRISCDGTGGDGAGLLCEWGPYHHRVQAWLSESSVRQVMFDRALLEER